MEKDRTVLALQVCQYICSSVVLFLLFVSLTPYPLQNLFHKAWGELCLGLAAPRRTPASTDDSSLSFEVVKVMLEYGMAHSHGCHKKCLIGPPSSSVDLRQLIETP